MKILIKVHFILILIVLIFTSKAQICKPLAVNYGDSIVLKFRNDPVCFKEKFLDSYIDSLKDNNMIRDLIPKLFDNMTGIRENSEASNGLMGSLNISYSKKANSVFFRKINKKGRASKYVVVVEGDSWFNFPTPLKSDLTKLLTKKKNILTYTSAFGGDWIARMIKDQSYFDAIVRTRPNAFILSGGGNDIVGERLSEFVDLPINNFQVHENKNALLESFTLSDKEITSYLTSNSSALTPPDTVGVGVGINYLNKNFFKFLVELELQYKLILQQIINEHKENGAPGVKKVNVIIQGYDYPVPRVNKAPLYCNPWRGVLNRFLNSGKWLYTPLELKGIRDAETKRYILKAIIYFFNEMQKSIVNNPKYDFVTHVDNRGFLDYLGGVEPARYWFDELHPKEKPYTVIADVLEGIITGQIKENYVNTLTYYKKTDKNPDKTERIRNRKNKCGCYKYK